VKALVLAALLLAPTAHADDKLGFNLGFGAARLGDTRIGNGQLGLGVEHRIGRKLRALAEYDWLWIGNSDEMVERTATAGHRANVGLRRRIARKRILYADVEGGAGFGIYDTRTATYAAPHAFAGLRGGYRLPVGKRGDSRAFETAVSLRVLASHTGYGGTITFGFYWDD
jgi:hypothetical protein